jgi:hypothetical protein
MRRIEVDTDIPAADSDEEITEMHTQRRNG